MSDIDFRKRNIRPVEIAPGVECLAITYGLTAAEMGDGGHDAEDIVDRFDHSGEQARRPGSRVAVSQHFFNRRIV